MLWSIFRVDVSLQWATWCTDDLCGLLDFCNETEVMSVADALVSTGMKDLGYNLVLVSYRE